MNSHSALMQGRAAGTVRRFLGRQVGSIGQLTTSARGEYFSSLVTNSTTLSPSFFVREEMTLRVWVSRASFVSMLDLSRSMTKVWEIRSAKMYP